MSDIEPTLIITGRVISPGLAEGRTFLHRDMLRNLDAPVAIETKNIEHEIGHLEDATAMITGDLLTLATRVEKEMDSRLASIFETHQAMLNDPALKEELRAEIRSNLVSASSAVKSVFLRWEKRFLLMESQLARQKGEDMHDISNRLSDALAGVKIHPLERIPPGSVLVASRLLPSDTIFLSQQSTAAVLMEHGGSGSHAALFAREMGLPCIANIPTILKRIPANAWVLVDAHLGEVIVHPQAEHKISFQNKVATRQEVLVAAQQRAQEPAVTRDGVTIAVLANVGCREDTERAMANGAEGIGLYRTEQAYMGRLMPPTVDELLDEMRAALEPAKGKPICVRLLDIGADKPLPFIGFLAESNPALGRRGIRLLREFPHLLETQLRAILKLSQEFKVCILVPMVTRPEDLAEVKECLTRLGLDLGISPLPLLGAMIETPAAALSTRSLEPHAEFLSFGTNDLTQYAFAADRENAAVEQYFTDSSDVIFRLLQMAHDDTPHLPLSACGELAGRPAHIPKLLSCGIRTLSVAPPLIPIIKEAIRESWGRQRRPDQQPAEVKKGPIKEKPLILVVDDQLPNIKLLEGFLVPQGYDIIQSSNGEDALGKLAEHPIDLILLDVRMPGLDGFEVTRRVRQDEAHRLLPIILVTALRETEDRVKGLEAGCDDFISKPIERLELLARVRSLLKVHAYNELLSHYRKELESEAAHRTEDLRLALDRIKASSLETIYRLSMASEYKDEDTGAHIQRMSQYSAAVARQMGLDENTIETILYAAPMHDLGKIGIPDQILMKPAKLDPAEWEIMKQHTVIGAKILKGSDAEIIQLGEVIAMSHHEKWDGSGYPHKLKGLEIPLAGRITAVADVFDALTSKRPYKEAFSMEQFWPVIREGRGSHFDPAVVDAFFAIQDEILAIKKQLDNGRDRNDTC